MTAPQLFSEGPADARLTIALAHGANAPMDSAFMDFVAGGLAAHCYRVVRFEFPYMAGRRGDGKRRPPDRPDVLLNTWRRVIEAIATGEARRRLVIGGKSLGGRIASMIADEAEVGGLVCLGYPFHPARAPRKPRVEHLRILRTPTLIVQGTRDPLGLPVEVMGYELPPSVTVRWLDDGDHGFAPRKSSGRTEQQNLDEALETVRSFLAKLAA